MDKLKEKLDVELQQNMNEDDENKNEGVKSVTQSGVISGTKSGVRSGSKSKDNEVFNSMERMIQLKSREKLGYLESDQSMVDNILIEEEEQEELETSELIDTFDENIDQTVDPFIDDFTNHERNNTEISSTNDDNSYEPSHVLLQKRLKQIKKVHMKSLP